MPHAHMSPSHPGKSIPGTTRLGALFTSVVLFLTVGCGADSPTAAGLDGRSDQLDLPAAAHPGFSQAAGGATKISGMGYYSEPGQCSDPEGAASDYSLMLTGDLQGCVYVFVETSRCVPGGAYIETGTETFVGSYNGAAGTFRTTYRFTATYRDCANLGGQIAGRCQHPLIAGSGKGAFAGVTGRIDMTDDVKAGNFAYRGHFR
jgi:hypothetical protein